MVLQFDVSDPVPQVAATLATAYAHQYTLYRRDLDTKAYIAAQKELRDQMAKLEASGVDPK